MNAMYVTVSIPLLLVLAEFNHAYGLTTFGKSSNNQQNVPAAPPAQPRRCQQQANCTVIRGTTCVSGNCLCGDGTHPVNGGCKAQLKAPRHVCETDTDCVDNADCLPSKEKIDPGIDKVCTCQEGFVQSHNQCSGASSLMVLPGTILISLILIFSRNFDTRYFSDVAP